MDVLLTLDTSVFWNEYCLIAPKDEAYLFHRVTILDDLECELATAHGSAAGEEWMVITLAVGLAQNQKTVWRTLWGD